MGDQVKHIAPMLNIGKSNIDSFDIFSSKIMLEMKMVTLEISTIS